MQAPWSAVLLNCDSQHFVSRYPPGEVHARSQVSQRCSRLSANALILKRPFGARLRVPGYEHDASNWAARDELNLPARCGNRKECVPDGVSI
jgi:hypothetical protein